MNSILVIAPPPTRIYRVKWLWKGFMVALLFFAIFCLVMVLRQCLITGVFVNPFLILVFIAVLILAIYLCIEFFNANIECTPESVNSMTIHKKKTLPISKIRGRREYVESSGDSSTKYMMLESNDPKFESLRFEKRFQFDEEFYTWFNSLPDLDAND